MISEHIKKKIVTVLGVLCVGAILFYAGKSLFDTNNGATTASQSASSTNKQPDIEGRPTAGKDPAPSPSDTHQTEDDKKGGDKDSSGQATGKPTATVRKAKSKKAAKQFVRHFYNQTAQKPHGHIQASKPYMTDDFYQYTKTTYPMAAIGPKKQRWKSVKPFYFGRKDNFRIWDVRIQGRVTKKGGKPKKDRSRYVVKVLRQDGVFKVDNAWINPPIGRDQNGRIDLYHGQGHGNNDADIDVLIDTLKAYSEIGS